MKKTLLIILMILAISVIFILPQLPVQKLFDDSSESLIEADNSNEISQSRIAEKTKYLTAVKNLDIDAPKFAYEVTIVNGFYEVKLISKNLVKNLFVDSALEYNFSDNYFDLRPNEQKIIRIKRDKFHSLNSFKESLNFLSLHDTY